MINNHPSYPFPTIREVVCEIHFRLDMSWNTSLFSEYFRKIEAEFPTFEPVTVQVFLEITQQPGGAPSLAVPQVIRYKHASSNLLLQLSENRIAVNVLPVYPGWEQVREDIKYSWTKLCEVIQPVEITRIGLRYINGIERSTNSETFSRWLRPSNYVPPAILHSSRGFAAKISTHLDNKNRIQVILADQPSPDNDSGTFIFDIDRITQEIIPADVNLLLEKATDLHSDVWEVFQSAKSEDLECLLKGELI